MDFFEVPSSQGHKIQGWEYEEVRCSSSGEVEVPHGEIILS